MARCERCRREKQNLQPGLFTGEDLCAACRGEEERGAQGARVSREEARAWRDRLNPPRPRARRDGVHVHR